jgi:hypothetical protein
MADSYKNMLIWLAGVDQCHHSFREFFAELARTGVFRASDGRQISLRGAWFMSFVNWDQRREANRIGFANSGAQNSDHEALQRRLGADLLNGYDLIIDVQNAGRKDPIDNARHLLDVEIVRLRSLGLEIECDDGVAHRLARLTDDRAILDEIRSDLRDPLLAALLSGKTRFSLSADEAGYQIRPT